MKPLDAIDGLAVAALCGVGLIAFALLCSFLIPLALVGWAGQWLTSLVAGEDKPEQGDSV